MARKPTHFSKISADRSGEKMMSPTLLPSIITGNDAPIAGMRKQIRRTSAAPVPAGFAPRPAMRGPVIFGAPELDGFGCAKRLHKRVQCLLRIGGYLQRAVERIRYRLGRTRSRLGFVHQLCRRENCSETAPSNSAATNMMPSGRNSRVRSESLSTFGLF